MHNNFYFLSRLSAELDTLLTSGHVSECFSQDKDELIIRFRIKKTSFIIKADLQPEFSALSFPEKFNRAKKNSIDLFNSILDLQVTGIQQFLNERSFSIKLENEFELLFKMHGNRANVVLFSKSIPVALFKNHLENDWNIRVENLNRTIDWSYEAFNKNINQLAKHYFTFGKRVWHYLDESGFQSKSIEEKWNAIQQLLANLKHPSYFVNDNSGELYLSVMPSDKVVASYTSAIKAANEFYAMAVTRTAYNAEKKLLLINRKAKITNLEGYISKTKSKLAQLDGDNRHRQWADLIMAHLGSIRQGVNRIDLPDFKSGEMVTIKLKETLSPQKNAEMYYRKAKNHHIEIEKLKESIRQKELELVAISNQVKSIEETTNLKALRSLAATINQEPAKATEKLKLPYHEVEFMGYRIRIGKNSRANDELTQQYTSSDDLWLHAKDVSGSHVVIKNQPGKNYPKEVIEKAASLAAYYSKRKTDSLCPVVYTQKKYVRKRKGDAPGAVVVTREIVIMVEPGK